MGDIKRKRKLYSRPKKPFDKARITEEDSIVEKYGLKNKREIWKAQSRVSILRRRAKSLIGADAQTQKTFFEKLNHLGFNVSSIAEALGLSVNNLLDRRLQSVLYKKKMANSPHAARQLIVHKHVLVDGNIVNIPSFHVNRERESKISLKQRKIRPAKKEAADTNTKEERELEVAA